MPVYTLDKEQLPGLLQPRVQEDHLHADGCLVHHVLQVQNHQILYTEGLKASGRSSYWLKYLVNVCTEFHTIITHINVPLLKQSTLLLLLDDYDYDYCYLNYYY